MPVPLTLTVVAAAALVTPVFLAGNSGLLPEILDGDRYTLGRSLFGMVSSGAQVAALGLGGALLSVLPARWLLIVAGVLLAASAMVTRLGLRYRPARAGAGSSADAGRAGGIGGGARGTVRATLAGNRELLATPGLRRLLLMQWLPAWFATGLMGGQGLLPSAFGGVATALGAGGAIALAGACVVVSALLAWKAGKPLRIIGSSREQEGHG
jgi:hypothetical protein